MPHFYLTFLVLSCSEGCSQTHLDWLGSPTNCCRLPLPAVLPFLKTLVSAKLLAREMVASQNPARAVPVPVAWVGGMGVRTDLPPLVPPGCLLETEWERIGWGSLGTVGPCGSCRVRINKAKLSDADNPTTFSRSKFHGGVFFWLVVILDQEIVWCYKWGSSGLFLACLSTTAESSLELLG